MTLTFRASLAAEAGRAGAYKRGVHAETAAAVRARVGIAPVRAGLAVLALKPRPLTVAVVRARTVGAHPIAAGR